MGQLYLFAQSPIGIFVFSPKGDLIYYKLFSRNPARAVDEFLAASEKDVKQHVDGELVEGPAGYQILRQNFREYAKSLGFAENDMQLNEFLSSFGYLLSKKRLAGLITKDRLLVQAVNAFDDLGRVVNLFYERLYEWFSLHYPEIKSTKNLAEKIIEYGRRENFPEFRESTGIELSDKDEEILIAFATTLQNLIEEKERLENYVAMTVREIAPNLSSLVDPILAARLIAQAGSLEKLSRMPASTIQLLGAEKALFRHLHKKGKSPKFGIIFTSSAIQNASADRKGKAARILASKLMLASRIDYYSGRYEEKLRKELDEELKKL
jgi:nucleolar protein 56